MSTAGDVTVVDKALIKGRYACRGDTAVITASLPMAEWGKTKFLKVHRIE